MFFISQFDYSKIIVFSLINSCAVSDNDTLGKMILEHIDVAADGSAGEGFWIKLPEQLFEAACCFVRKVLNCIRNHISTLLSFSFLFLLPVSSGFFVVLHHMARTKTIEIGYKIYFDLLNVFMQWNSNQLSLRNSSYSTLTLFFFVWWKVCRPAQRHLFALR